MNYGTGRGGGSIAPRAAGILIMAIGLVFAALAAAGLWIPPPIGFCGWDGCSSGALGPLWQATLFSIGGMLVLLAVFLLRRSHERLPQAPF